MFKLLQNVEVAVTVFVSVEVVVFISVAAADVISCYYH